MPKGRVLSLEEREEIVRLHRTGVSAREIGKKLQRSKTVVLNFLKNPEQYAQIKRSGRKRALNKADEQRLYDALFRPPPPPSSSSMTELEEGGFDGGEISTLQQQQQCVKMSAEQIKKQFDVPLSIRRIQQLLSEWRRDARRQQDQRHQLIREQSVSLSSEAEKNVPDTVIAAVEGGTDGTLVTCVAQEDREEEDFKALDSTEELLTSSPPSLATNNSTTTNITMNVVL